MKILERLNVTPYVFYGFGLIFFYNLSSQGEPCFFTDMLGSDRLHPDITPLWAQLSINNKETASITVTTTLPGKSRLMLDVRDADWATIQPWWERFKTELIEEGLIDTPATDAPAISAPSVSRGGPKATPEDDRRKHILEWRRVEGSMTQDAFCAKNGMGSSTLRRWIRDFEAKGEKL